MRRVVLTELTFAKRFVEIAVEHRTTRAERTNRYEPLQEIFIIKFIKIF